MPSLEELLVVFVTLMGPVLVHIMTGRLRCRRSKNVRPHRVISFHTASVEIRDDVTLRLTQDDEVILKAAIGCTIPSSAAYDVVLESDTLIIDWKTYAKVMVTHDQPENCHKYDIEWEVYGCGELKDSFDLASGVHWYGGGHIFSQPWPVEKWQCGQSPMVTGEPGPLGGGYGGIQERMWITASGSGLFVDPMVPLFLSINNRGNGRLTLDSKYQTPYRNTDGRNLFLRYTLHQTPSVKVARHQIFEYHIPKPNGIPDRRMFVHPIWSTWAQYKTDISQDKILEFAAAVRKHGFKDAHIQIDDGWTPHYGDWEFDSRKFPDAKDMVSKLKALGHRVTLWVHPFANVTSRTFREGWGAGWWMKYNCCGIPALVFWWDGLAAVLDVTNDEAVSWYQNKLRYLREHYGIDSFKFDAGDAVYVPMWSHSSKEFSTPNTYTRRFVEIAHEADTRLRAQEMRTGTCAQDTPMFFRLQDKDSNWGHFNGLKTVIPHVLTQGLLGYPFVLPDMIGGNAYGATGRPDRELFIRWMQVNALLPAMQFSVPPWYYDEDVVAIAREVCALHEKWSGKIMELAEEATQTGYPIIRPVWWIAPEDETALTISTEFLLGDDVLVAPVLDKGSISRDVYLPQGQWRDELHGEIKQGPCWYRNVPAALHQLPYFTRTNEHST